MFTGHLSLLSLPVTTLGPLLIVILIPAILLDLDTMRTMPGRCTESVRPSDGRSSEGLR